MITITGVKLSPDLRTATVQVSVMPHEKQELTLHGLRSAARHIRHDVGDEVAIHQMPELTFRLDHALEHQAGVLDALARAARERAEREGSDPAGRPQSAESAGKDAYAQGPQEDGPA
jgi:ribosome-binding factor A